MARARGSGSGGDWSHGIWAREGLGSAGPRQFWHPPGARQAAASRPLCREECCPEGGQGGRVRPASGEGGRNSRRQGCLRRRTGPRTRISPRSPPPRGPPRPAGPKLVQSWQLAVKRGSLPGASAAAPGRPGAGLKRERSTQQAQRGLEPRPEPPRGPIRPPPRPGRPPRPGGTAAVERAACPERSWPHTGDLFRDAGNLGEPGLKPAGGGHCGSCGSCPGPPAPLFPPLFPPHALRKAARGDAVGVGEPSEGKGKKKNFKKKEFSLSQEKKKSYSYKGGGGGGRRPRPARPHRGA